MKEAININSALITKWTRDMKDPAKRPAKRVEIRDTSLKGFMLRVEPSGKMTYCMVYAHGKRYTIGSTEQFDPAQARAKAMDVLSGHQKEKNGDGEDPIEKKQRVDREKKEARERAKAENYLNFLDTVYEPYLKTSLRRGQDNRENVKETMACLKNRFAEFHDKGLGEITPLMIDRWIQQRASEVKPASIKRQLNDLHACFNYAVKRKMLAANPFSEMDPYEASDNERVRYLSPDEETKLYKALNDREASMRAERQQSNEWRAARGYDLLPDLSKLPYVDHLKPAVLLSLNTGLRRGELLKLKWENINFAQGVLTVPARASKNGKPRHIKLNKTAADVLRAWKEMPVTDMVYVFGGAQKRREDRQEERTFHDMNTAWKNVLGKAEITDFTWHDLRHHFASKLVQQGADLNKVRELLGHSDYKLTLRYSHLSPEHMQDVVDLLVPATAAG